MSFWALADLKIQSSLIKFMLLIESQDRNVFGSWKIPAGEKWIITEEGVSTDGNVLLGTYLSSSLQNMMPINGICIACLEKIPSPTQSHLLAPHGPGSWECDVVCSQVGGRADLHLID